MSVMAKKVIGVTLAVAVVGVAIALYVADWATSFPPPVSSTVNPVSAGGGANLTIETVGAVGRKVSPANPDWVSYLVKSHGRWVHSTIYTVPANSVVHVTLYEFDSASGLRNQFFSQVQGTVGGTMTLDGKTVNAVNGEEAAHSFAIPELGVFVPLPGVSEAEEEKDFCEEAPCEPGQYHHRTITFSFRTGKKGHYRWQCFVPCGAGFLNGNGGPMQTLGYMDGFIDVV
ncbi:MAG TPA: hypothetical protein VK778_04415 [Solirubrobacteraceae bacterium]|jgi:hypothetical protein|nr:hypothetical protein [Solirubrobacteraceae bacterium]